MRAVTKAIVSYFKADPMAVPFTACYNTVAPPNATFPYLVFSFLSNTQDYTFTEKFEEYLVQFDIFSNESSSSEMSYLIDALHGSSDLATGFDFAILDVAGFEFIFCLRDSSLPITRWDINGVKVWNYSVQYRILLEKQ